MLSKVNVMKIFFSFLALILFVFSRLSYADWSIGIGVGDRHDDRWEHHEDHHDDRWEHHDEDHFYRWHEHPHWGLHSRSLPLICDTIWVGYARYYYCDGLYYTYAGYGDYVMVEPPLGAYVDRLPPDFHPVINNGEIYYSDNGIYYIATPHGYRVVSPPVVGYVQQPQVIYIQPATTVVTTQVPPPAPVAVNSQDTFPVNVPNNSGGYTTVVIKKSGNGYVGPQGEFYSTFPTVAQLKMMYVK